MFRSITRCYGTFMFNLQIRFCLQPLYHCSPCGKFNRTKFIFTLLVKTISFLVPRGERFNTTEARTPKLHIPNIKITSETLLFVLFAYYSRFPHNVISKYILNP